MNPRTISIVAVFVLVAAILVLFYNGALFARGPIAIALQIGAALWIVWARITFGARSFHAAANPTEGGLVTTGPYRYARHPIYGAVMLFVGAGVASHFSITNLAAALVVFAASFARLLSEEKLVVGHYPEYRDYAARTKRLIPFVY